MSVLALLAIMLVGNGGAGAQGDGPLTVEPETVTAGGAVVFSGSGCVAGAQVEFRAFRGDINAPEIEILGDVEADPQGDFSMTLEIPPATSPGPLTIEARCGSSPTSSQTLVAEIEVTAGELPATGRNSAILSATGGLAIAAGAAMLAVRRRWLPE